MKYDTIIIGGGMSGVLAAYRLREAGIPFIVIEKNASVGGTWFENRYPGARVDVGNHLYSYSFEPAHHWSQYFSQQKELQEYQEKYFGEMSKGMRVFWGTAAEFVAELKQRWDEFIKQG